VEKVIELSLNTEERNALEVSAEKIREVIDQLRNILPATVSLPVG